MLLKRIKKEKSEYLKNQILGVKVDFDEKNPQEIYFTIEGPKGTPYYGGQFNFKFIFTADYPYQPMKIISLQKIYFYLEFNCVIKGSSCCANYVGLSNDQWSPTLTFDYYIRGLLKCFYPENFIHHSNVCSESSLLYKSNRNLFNLNVKNMIATEDAKKLIKQFIVFEREIKQFLYMNSDEIFIDLFF